jgi:hypothetical protein
VFSGGADATPLVNSGMILDFTRLHKRLLGSGGTQKLGVNMPLWLLFYVLVGIRLDWT